MSEHALAGIRVLDLTRLLPGGLCTLVLADFGADVIKVEAPGGGDYARARAPHLADEDDTTSSASFRALNRNKRSVIVDLKTAAGRAAMLRLVRDADVLVESFRPGVLERLGLGSRRSREFSRPRKHGRLPKACGAVEWFATRCTGARTVGSHLQRLRRSSGRPVA